MQEIAYIDQTIRDAQQSLWGHKMSIDMVLPIIPVMDQIGYRTIAIVGGRGMISFLRRFGENPFERLRLFAEGFKKTPLRSSCSIWGLSGFDLEPLAATEIWIKWAVANGVKSFMVFDYLNLMDRVTQVVKMVKAEGAEVAATLMCTLSPVHTDEYYARKTRKIMEIKDYVDTLIVNDDDAILTPERTPEIVSIVQQNCDGMPLEIHSHCMTGLAPLCYLEAIKAGIPIVHTAVLPLANGVSVPSTENILKNSRRLGYSSNLDEEAVKVMSDHFKKASEEHGLQTGKVVEYDLFHYEHQVPGGMTGTMRNQLAEIGQEEQLQEVLEEVAVVRKEFGYPIMITPYSQAVGSQALFNITSGERYKIVSDEVIKFAMGLWGEVDAPMDQNVKDKILSSPKAKKYLNWKIPEITAEELRREIGPGLSDEDLLLQLLDPRGEVKRKVDVLYGRK